MEIETLYCTDCEQDVVPVRRLGTDYIFLSCPYCEKTLTVLGPTHRNKGLLGDVVIMPDGPMYVHYDHGVYRIDADDIIEHIIRPRLKEE